VDKHRLKDLRGAAEVTLISHAGSSVMEVKPSFIENSNVPEQHDINPPNFRDVMTLINIKRKARVLGKKRCAAFER
jgi:hypothetical protein